MEFNKLYNELITLSEILYEQQGFRACFFRHFNAKVKELNEKQSVTDVKILKELQLKLLPPVMYHLIHAKKSEDQCELLNGLVEVIKVVVIDSDNVFFHLYLLIFFKIYKKDNLNYKLPEELKMAVLKCGSVLIKNSSMNVLEQVYDEKSCEKFSMGILLAVQIAKEERSIQLRLAALDFLLSATLFHKTIKYNEGIHQKVGDLFMRYLPGTIGPLQEIILRDETQHHKITVKALSCWGHILCLVMCDSSTSENISETEIIQNWIKDQKQNKEIIDVKKALQEKKRTKSWLEAAALTLKPLLWKVPEVRKHSNMKCRLELTKVMIKLLQNCMINLKSSLTPIIEVLVSSEVDEDEEVCRIAQEAISRFEVMCGQQSQAVFLTVIEENLYHLVHRLPGIVHGQNEKLILPALKSFLGYLKILGRMNRLQQLVSLSSTLKKLLVFLQLSVELDTYPEISSQDFSVWENDINTKTWAKPWKRFRHFADQSIRYQLEDACHVLGECGEIETILDHLLDCYQKDYTSRKELLLILNEVISGSKNLEDHVVNQLLNFYLDPENLYLPLQVDEVDCPNVKEAHSNIIKVALIMEGIGKLATVLGRRFEGCLLKVLYYVIERMGSSYSVIRETATKSAMEISTACGLNGSISYLIQKNVDYLTYHLTTKLRRNNTGVFDMVTVLVKNSPFETMPNLEEIVNDVLKSSSNNYDSPHTTSYLRLFQTVVMCVNKWVKTTDQKIIIQPEQKTINALVMYFKKQTENEEMLTDDQEPPDLDEEELPEPEPDKPKPPRHINMIISIANHSLNYLSSKDKDKKLIVLELLKESLLILVDWEDELLPLVHKIWSPLVTRYDQTTDPLIISRSFTLLCTMSHTSRQFIRSRTLKEVLPTLQSFLTKSASKSKLKDSSSGYYFTQNFKLQRNLLENLGKLAFDLELFEKQTDLVAECALPYLSSLQPKELQEKCRLTFFHLNNYDPYLVWLKLYGLLKNPEYVKNVEIVLNVKI